MRHSAAVRHSQPRGLTLVETLVVLAVLAVLLGLGVPGLTGWRERQQLQAQAQALWNSLMLARAQALLHQQRVSLCAVSATGVCAADAHWHGGWLVFLDGNRNGQRDAQERVIEQREAAPGTVRMVGNSTVTHVVGYNAEGRSETLKGVFQAGTVRVCTASQAQGWQVVINAVGRPRLEKTAMSSCP